MLKVDIRKKFKEKRKILSEKERLHLSNQIAQIVATSFTLKNKVVSIFLPIERLNEVNTTFLMDHLKDSGCTVSTPVSDFSSLELKHVIYNDETILKNNVWGIPEPISGERIQPEDLNFVFVPLLISDRNGYRVGYGKGFYDRFLPQCSRNTVFIGLNFFEDLVDIEDINMDDIPLHFLVTPSKILKF
jgi:5-formyltetrahydrofolate cyclo-ligase